MIAPLMESPFLLEADERVLLCVKQHWCAFWPAFIARLAIGAFPAGFAAGLLSRIGIVDARVWHIVIVVAALWLACWLAAALLLRRRHQRSVYAITDRRVVVVRTNLLFGARASSTALADIGDVRTRVDGLAAVLFGFGDVEFGSTHVGQQCTLATVGHPRDVALSLSAACQQAHSQDRRGQIHRGRGTPSGSSPPSATKRA